MMYPLWSTLCWRPRVRLGVRRAGVITRACPHVCCCCAACVCNLGLAPASQQPRSTRAGAGRLAFVGHSQGTTQAFAALASQPGLAAQLSCAVMLAPAVHMRHIQSYPLNFLAAMDADRVGRCCAREAP